MYAYPFAGFILPDSNATAGTALEYHIPQNLDPQSQPGLQLSTSFSPETANAWLRFDASALTLTGIPEQPGVITVKILATYVSGNANVTLTNSFLLHVNPRPGHHRRRYALVASILGLFMILVILCSVFMCYRYRRRNGRQVNDFDIHQRPSFSLGKEPTNSDESLDLKSKRYESYSPEPGLTAVAASSLSLAPTLEVEEASQLDASGIRLVSKFKSVISPASPTPSWDGRPRRLTLLDQIDGLSQPITASGHNRQPAITFSNSESLDYLRSISQRSIATSTSVSPAKRSASSPGSRPRFTRPRSINSAYSSLASWESESTWFAQRRRRPPSPCWRRKDFCPPDPNYTFADFLREEKEQEEKERREREGNLGWGKRSRGTLTLEGEEATEWGEKMGSMTLSGELYKETTPAPPLAHSTLSLAASSSGTLERLFGTAPIARPSTSKSSFLGSTITRSDLRTTTTMSSHALQLMESPTIDAIVSFSNDA